MSTTDAFIEAIAEAVVRKLGGTIPASQVDNSLMSVPNAAKYLGRTSSSVRGLIATGQIPQKIVKRIGGRVCLLKSELDKWVAAQ